MAETQGMKIDWHSKQAEMDKNTQNNQQVMKLETRLQELSKEWRDFIDGEETKTSFLTTLERLQTALYTAIGGNITAMNQQVQDELDKQRILFMQAFDKNQVALNETLIAREQLWYEKLTHLDNQWNQQSNLSKNEWMNHLQLANQSWASHMSTLNETLLTAVASDRLLHTHAIDAINTTLRTTFTQSIDALSQLTADSIQALKTELQDQSAGFNSSLTDLTHHYNQSMLATATTISRQITELSSNASSALGKSNAILAKAIGDVNTTVNQLVQETTNALTNVRSEQLIAIRALKDSAQVAIDELANRTIQLKSELSQEIIDKSEAVVSLFTQLKNNLQEGLGQVNESLVVGLDWVEHRVEMMRILQEQGMSHLQAEVTNVNTTVFQYIDSVEQRILKEELPLMKQSIDQQSTNWNHTLQDNMLAMKQLVQTGINTTLEKVSALQDQWQMSQSQSQLAMTSLQSNLTSGLQGLEHVLTSYQQRSQLALNQTTHALYINFNDSIMSLNHTLVNHVDKVTAEHVATIRDNWLPTLRSQMETIIYNHSDYMAKSTLLASQQQFEEALHPITQQIDSQLVSLQKSWTETNADLVGLNHTLQLRLEQHNHTVYELIDTTAQSTFASLSQANESLSTEITVLRQKLLPEAIDTLTTTVHNNISTLSALTGQSVKILADKLILYANTSEANIKQEVAKLLDIINATSVDQGNGLKGWVQEQLLNVEGNHSLAMGNLHQEMVTTRQLQEVVVQQMNTSIAFLASNLTHTTISWGEHLAAVTSATNATLQQIAERSSQQAVEIKALLWSNLTALSSELQGKLDSLGAKLSADIVSTNTSLTGALVTSLSQTTMQLRDEFSQQLNNTMGALQGELASVSRELAAAVIASESNTNASLVLLRNETQRLSTQSQHLTQELAAVSDRIIASKQDIESQLESLESKHMKEIAEQETLRRKEIDRLSNALETSQADISTMQRDLSHIYTDISNNTASIQLLHTASDQQKVSIHTLEKTIAVAEDAHSQLATSVTLLQQTQSTVTQKVEQLEAVVYPTIHTQLLQQADRLAVLETSKSNAKDVTKELMASFQSVTASSITGITSKQTDTEQSLTELTTRIEQLVVTSTATDGLVTGHISPQLTKLQAQVDSLEKTSGDNVKDMKQQHATLAGEVASMKETTAVYSATQHQEIEALKKRIDTLSQEHTTQMSSLTSQLAAAQETQTATAKSLAIAEATIVSYERRIALLEEENAKTRREMASQAAVDSLRLLLHDMQTSMMTHSGKVLELLLSQQQQQQQLKP